MGATTDCLPLLRRVDRVKFIFTIVCLCICAIGIEAEMIKWRCVDLKKRDICDRVSDICLLLCIVCMVGMIIAPA